MWLPESNCHTLAVLIIKIIKIYLRNLDLFLVFCFFSSICLFSLTAFYEKIEKSNRQER